MDNEFLHKIDVRKVSEETGLSLDEIAALSGISDSRNLNKWSKDKSSGSRPNFNALVNLLLHGATVETLFGVEYKGSKNPVPKNIYDNPEFKAGVKMALMELEEEGFLREKKNL